MKFSEDGKEVTMTIEELSGLLRAAQANQMPPYPAYPLPPSYPAYPWWQGPVTTCKLGVF